MAYLSDEIASKAINDGTKAARESLKAAQKVTSEALKAGEAAVKGICLLILDGGAFTTENVMKAVKSVAFKKTGDVKYSKNNIDITALQKSGRVFKLDENITADVMKHFDAQCKKYGVKYAAMKDERNPDKPAYMVFFEGKNSEMILHVMQEAYKDYIEAQKEEKVPNRKHAQRDQQKNTGRESVKAKLAFFGIGLQLGIKSAIQ